MPDAQPTTPILAWHFLAEDRKMAYRRTLVQVGKTYSTRKPLAFCSSGLHASVRIIDALQYAPGPICCRVRMSGQIMEDYDKLCSSRRKVLAMADITAVLHEFSCRVAEEALRAANVTDPRSWAAIEAKRKWLQGEITDEELAAAWAAAWDVARAAARAAQNTLLTQMVCEAMGLEVPNE